VNSRVARLLAVTMGFTLLISFVLPPAPVAGSGVDLINNPPTGWSVVARACSGGSCADPANATDANDGTFAVWNTGPGSGCGGGGAPRTCRAYVQWSRSSGVTTQLVQSFRALWGWGAGSAPNITSISLEVYDGSSWVTCYTAVAGAAGELLADCPTGLNLDSTTGGMYARVNFEVPDSSNADLRLYSYEVYGTSQTAPTTFTDYVYGLRLLHPPFQRVISWFWAKTWTGAWSISSANDGELVSHPGPGSGGTQDGTESFTIQCPVVCTHDTYTVHVQPNGGTDGTYDIDSDLNGYAIAPTSAAIISYVEGCYNLTASQCAAPLAGAVDVAGVRFTLTTAIAGRDATGTVSFGRWDRTQDGCVFVGSYVTTAPLASGATYTQLISAWDQGGGFFDADGKQLWLVRWNSSRDGYHETCKTLAVDVTTGGGVSVRSTPVATTTPCEGLEGLACAVREALAVAEDALIDRTTDAVEGLRSAALQKQPFNFIVRGYDGVSAQLTRALAAVTTTSTCAGYTMVLPSMPPAYYTGFAGATSAPAWPTSVPQPSFTVLRCADFEPLGGTSWWQTIRGAMGTATYLLYAYSQLRRLQPHLALGG